MEGKVFSQQFTIPFPPNIVNSERKVSEGELDVDFHEDEKSSVLDILNSWQKLIENPPHKILTYGTVKEELEKRGLKLPENLEHLSDCKVTSLSIELSKIKDTK